MILKMTSTLAILTPCQNTKTIKRVADREAKCHAVNWGNPTHASELSVQLTPPSSPSNFTTILC